MSRWGGFKKGKQQIAGNWQDMKSPSSSLQNVTSINASNFYYGDSKGIWNLRSTMEFPKSNKSSKDLTLVGTTIGTTSITIPANIQAGDLAISYASSHSSSVSGTYSIAGGFTQVRQDVDAADSVMISSYKVLTEADAGATISAFNLSGGLNYCAVIIFRPSNPIISVTPFSINGQAIITDPSAQTINMSLAGSYSSIVAAAFLSGTTALAETISPDMTEVVVHPNSSAFYTVFNQDLTPTNITVDMPDEGDNVMQSWGLAIN